jgi:Protein of unknown function (DUF1115)
MTAGTTTDRPGHISTARAGAALRCCYRVLVKAAMVMRDDRNEARVRREAEIDFVRAAYDAETEAWMEDRDGVPVIVRRLLSSRSSYADDDETDDDSPTSFLLRLELPNGYPTDTSLIVASCTVERLSSRRGLPVVAAAHSAAYELLATCRSVVADEHEHRHGEEAVFAVLQRADDWIGNEWPAIMALAKLQNNPRPATNHQLDDAKNDEPVWWGRNLIYSHHIIGKQKRADLQALATELDITGYVKIGWPGLIVLEGLEVHCRLFYDTIRRWAWQYLVLRGEMKERIAKHSLLNLNSLRKFRTFTEVDSLSVVAEHCRRTGLEDLFLTSIKVQAKNGQSSSSSSRGMGSGSCLLETYEQEEESSTVLSSFYGALVHVDHMNDAKQYRKWLRRSCTDLDVCLLIQQCFVGNSRPRIVVALVGSDEVSVSAVLKKWRSTKVDVDSRGLPCLERNMTVLVQGTIDAFDGSLWEEAASDNRVNTTKEKLLILLELSTQTKSWLEAIQLLMPH